MDRSCRERRSGSGWLHRLRHLRQRLGNRLTVSVVWGAVSLRVHSHVAALLVVTGLLAGTARSAHAATGPSSLRLTIPKLEGSATYVIDNRQSGAQTPIRFEEHMTWRLSAPAHRRVSFGGLIELPITVHVNAIAHGVYGDFTGATARYIPYDCTASATSSRRARLKATRTAAGRWRLAVTPFRAEGIEPGAATCTDKGQEPTFFFPTGTSWFASHLTVPIVLTRLGAFVTLRFASRSIPANDCRDPPGVGGPCTETLQFTEQTTLAARRR
jgi:hypothetical protein